MSTQPPTHSPSILSTASSIAAAAGGTGDDNNKNNLSSISSIHNNINNTNYTSSSSILSPSSTSGALSSSISRHQLPPLTTTSNQSNSSNNQPRTSHHYSASASTTHNKTKSNNNSSSSSSSPSSYTSGIKFRNIDWKDWYGKLQSSALSSLSEEEQARIHDKIKEHNDHLEEVRTNKNNKDLLDRLQEEEAEELKVKNMERAVDDKEKEIDEHWANVHARMLLYENVKNSQSRDAVDRVAVERRNQHLKDIEQRQVAADRTIARMLRRQRMLQSNGNVDVADAERDREKAEHDYEDGKEAIMNRLMDAENEEDIDNCTELTDEEKKEIKKKRYIASITGSGGNNTNNSINTSTNAAVNNNHYSTSGTTAAASSPSSLDEALRGVLKVTRADELRDQEMTITERRSQLYRLREESRKMVQRKLYGDDAVEEENKGKGNGTEQEKEEENQQQSVLASSSSSSFSSPATTHQERMDQIRANDKLSAILYEQKQLNHQRIVEDRLRRVADQVAVQHAGKLCEQEARFRRVAQTAEKQRTLFEQKRVLLATLSERGAKLKAEKDRQGLMELKEEFLRGAAEIDSALKELVIEDDE